MREIKFRAWNTEARVLIKAERILHVEFRNEQVTWIGYWYIAQDEDGDANQQLGQINNPILLQFTGLHDKNGKEIYEGDIVKADGYIFEVYWAGLAASFRYNDRDGNSESLLNYDDDLEVIGNIYENPAFLKA